MARVARRSGVGLVLYTAHAGWAHPWSARLRGAVFALIGLGLIAAFATYHPTDPSFNAASAEAPRNAMGGLGAAAADLALQSLGLGAWLIAATMVISGLLRVAQRNPAAFRWGTRWRVALAFIGVLCLVGLLAAPSPPANWPLAQGLGGVWGEIVLAVTGQAIAKAHLPGATLIAAVLLGAVGLAALATRHRGAADRRRRHGLDGGPPSSARPVVRPASGACARPRPSPVARAERAWLRPV